MWQALKVSNGGEQKEEEEVGRKRRKKALKRGLRFLSVGAKIATGRQCRPGATGSAGVLPAAVPAPLFLPKHPIRKP